MTKKNTNNKKFNPKTYLGKKRIYKSIPGAYRISSIYVWDEKQNEYLPPAYGKRYLARRWEAIPGEAKFHRKSEYFESLEDARNWQRKEQNTVPLPNDNLDKVSEVQVNPGPLFQEVVQEWKDTLYPTFSVGTKVTYEKNLRLYFQSLVKVPLCEITPQRIDQWLIELKKQSTRSAKRKHFRSELKLLSSILRFYLEYHDEDLAFRFPVKRRHQKAIWLKRIKTLDSKDFTESEFLTFCSELSTLKEGSLFAALATVQYYQALRISEAAALHWEDISFDWNNPSQSRLTIRRSIIWPRKKGLASFIADGFKNSDHLNGVKEQPLFPAAFEALRTFYKSNSKGLVFQMNGEHLSYRQIQYAYNTAFKKAGLPYTATHIMRHGGCRKVYNDVGDIAVAQQHLGNASIKEVMTYAKRKASALTEVSNLYWEQKSVEGGRKWSQKQRPDLKLLNFKGL